MILSEDRRRMAKEVVFGWACYEAETADGEQVTFRRVGLCRDLEGAKRWIGYELVELRSIPKPTVIDLKLS